MNRKKRIFLMCLFVAVVIGVSSVNAAKKAKTSVPLNSAGEKLVAEYTGMLTELRAKIEKSVPPLDEKESSAFMKAYAAVGKAQGSSKSKEAVAAAIKPVAAAQSKALTVAQPILADVEKFLAGDKLDALLVKCAVIVNATPRGLAEFAQQGKEKKALIDKLFSDTVLMKQMLLAGGAKLGKYGEAMQIYTDIMKASKLARKGGIFQRLAIGTSVELAIPATKRDKTEVDPVKRYLHYEKACLDGELDPEFKYMSAWECRFITNCSAPDEELAWGREMLRNYRPDHIFTTDYRWRYSRSVKTDVAYKRSDPLIEGLGFYQNIMNGGGVCGRRAFFGRFILRSFGIPTFGMRQRGHAALSHWTPDGWTVNFGAHWRWGWWDRPGHNRSGEDFLLETQAREYPKDYIKVLRAQWVGDALGEQKVNGRQLGTGGLWNALALYQKRAIVAEAKPVEVALAGEDLAEANESTKAEKIMQTKISEADRKIVVDKNGVVTIPAAACSKPKNNTSKIVFMKSFSDGMQLHYNRLGKEPKVFEYEFEIQKAGQYELVANVVTVNINQHLLVTPNNAGTPVDIALPYTVGMWKNTGPVEIELVKGKNILYFTRNIPNYGLTIKYFTLTPVKK